MDWYANIKRCYDWNCYTDEQVYQFVDLKKITKEQADEITSKETVSK